MFKIRDLGINAIPATMRPPESGAGAAFAVRECGDKESNCSISPQCEPASPCAAVSAGAGHSRGLTAEAVGQLKQHLYTYIQQV
jgi:hypothetical protein